MSSSAISGLGGSAAAPLTLTPEAIQALANPQTTAQPAPAPAASSSNGVQPILLVPTKPPLSSAVMAELMGHQTSPYGSAATGNATGAGSGEVSTNMMADQIAGSLATPVNGH